MKIITCVRQTPDTETLIKISGTGIESDGVKFVLGPYDAYALEAAAQIQEKVGGSVTVVTVGPDRPPKPCASAWLWEPRRPSTSWTTAPPETTPWLSRPRWPIKSKPWSMT